MVSVPPLSRRPNHCFLSYASEDATLARRLAAWLSAAGLQVWFDQTRMRGGSSVVDELTRRVCDSRTFVVVLTEAALEKGYVRHEVDIAAEQQVTTPGFVLLAVRTDPRLDPRDRFPALRKLSWLDVPAEGLDLDSARRILLALTPPVPVARDTRHVFVSCGWGESEAAFTRRVCIPLAERGVRLVGDAVDQRAFGETGMSRVRRILSGCSGHLLVLPERRSPGRTPEDLYKYFLAEWEAGRDLKLPRRVFCASRSALPEILAEEAVEIPRSGGDDLLDREIVALHDVTQPTTPHVFLAVEHRQGEERSEACRAVLQHVLGMECAMGRDFPGDDLRNAIVQTVREAGLVVADLGSRTDATSGRLVPNLNTIAEAGIAVGAGRPLYVTAHAPATAEPADGERTRQIPFMFRNSQIHWYADEVEFLAKVHAIAMASRRRILNGELGRRE